jgi:hypothetical protein
LLAESGLGSGRRPSGETRAAVPPGDDEKPKQFLAEKEDSSYIAPDNQKESRMIQDADRKAAKGGSKRRRATKRELAARDLKFVEKLAAGVTIEELAASEGVSPQWVRRRKAALLAQRAIDPPHEFIQLQIRRLSEAMLVAYSAMSNGNLHAVDRVVKIVREFDRYHGFGSYPNEQRLAAPSPAAPPLALPGPPAGFPAPGVETNSLPLLPPC